MKLQKKLSHLSIRKNNLGFYFWRELIRENTTVATVWHATLSCNTVAEKVLHAMTQQLWRGGIYIVMPQLAIQRTTVDSKHPSGFGFIPVNDLEGFKDPLKFIHTA